MSDVYGRPAWGWRRVRVALLERTCRRVGHHWRVVRLTHVRPGVMRRHDECRRCGMERWTGYG